MNKSRRITAVWFGLVAICIRGDDEIFVCDIVIEMKTMPFIGCTIQW